jgi:hypothetical protein
MRRWLVVCACAAGIAAGGLAAYLFTAPERDQLRSSYQTTAPEEPFRTVLVGTVINTYPSASYFTVEVVSPYHPQQKELLRVGVSQDTRFTIRTSPIAPVDTPAAVSGAEPSLADLRPGMSVSIEIERQPGPLQTNNVVLLQ